MKISKKKCSTTIDIKKESQERDRKVNDAVWSITTDGDCSHEIKRRLLLGRKVMTNLDSMFQKQRHYFANKGSSSQGYGFSCGLV